MKNEGSGFTVQSSGLEDEIYFKNHLIRKPLNP